MATKYLCLFLPFPLSVNGMFPGKARRFKSKAYEAWIKEAGYMLNRQETAHFGEPVSVVISLGRPDKVKRDVFNLEKGIGDLLVAHNILMDDSLIEDGRIRWDSEVVGARVEIAPIGALQPYRGIE